MYFHLEHVLNFISFHFNETNTPASRSMINQFLQLSQNFCFKNSQGDDIERDLLH